jgi:serine/threonine protein kinase
MTKENNNLRKLKISCPGCAQKLDVTGIAAFSEIHCPKCQCELKVPRRFAHFLLEDPVEHGPIASVYRAIDLKLDREVAVKIFDAAIGKTPETVEVFREITRKHAALNHPNIIPIYSSAEYEGFPYLTMEFMNRIGVRRKVADEGALPVSEALRITELAARGLDSARNEGVEHGDLHPRNILINADGEVKVSDFQMQRLTGAPPDITGTEACRTDPRYASPELLENGTQDYLGDIYSLGLILAFMIKGAHPISAEQAPHEEKIDWNAIAQPVPDTVKALVESMTSRFPDKRPQAYRKVISTIEKLRNSQVMDSDFEETAALVKKAGTKTDGKNKKSNAIKGELLKKTVRENRYRSLVRKALAVLILAALGFGTWTLYKGSKSRPDWYVDHVDPFLIKLRKAFRVSTTPVPDSTPRKNPLAENHHPTITTKTEKNQSTPRSNNDQADFEELDFHTPSTDEQTATFQFSQDSTAADGNNHTTVDTEPETIRNKAPSLNDRPRPPDLDFYAVKEQLLAYVQKQPEELQEIEKDRIRRLSSIRNYLQSAMHYIPFESEDGYIELSSGRKIRGSIPLCNDRGLTIRLDRRRAKLRTVEWKDIRIEQYQEFLEFYARQRLTASGGPGSLEIKITPRKDAANDYFLAALLSEWYGHPDDAAEYAKQAIKYDPDLQATIKRFFYYLID